MAFELLRTDYVDATFEGLRRYLMSENGDGSVSFHDVTNYTVQEKSFFGAKDANTINTAVNAILAALENGTDLYEVFTQFFELQKTLFLEESDAKQGDFADYIAQLIEYMDQKWDELKAEYTGDIQYFKDVQENAFNVWFQMVRDQLTNDVAGHLQTQIGNLDLLDTEDKESLVNAVNELKGADNKQNEQIGNLGDLQTAEKRSLVGAINSAISALTKKITDAFNKAVKKAGDTMDGPLHLANNAFNMVGDDVEIGDQNQPGTLFVKAHNNDTNTIIRMIRKGETNPVSPNKPFAEIGIYSDGAKFNGKAAGLQIGAVGKSTLPVYFDSNGVPVKVSETYVASAYPYKVFSSKYEQLGKMTNTKGWKYVPDCPTFEDITISENLTEEEARNISWMIHDPLIFQKSYNGGMLDIVGAMTDLDQLKAITVGNKPIYCSTGSNTSGSAMTLYSSGKNCKFGQYYLFILGGGPAASGVEDYARIGVAVGLKAKSTVSFFNLGVWGSTARANIALDLALGTTYSLKFTIPNNVKYSVSVYPLYRGTQGNH